MSTICRPSGDSVAVLAATDVYDRADLYAALGLRLSYEPDRRRLIMEARPAEGFGQSSCRQPDDDQRPSAVPRGELELR